MDPYDEVLRASEIGEYVHCHRAWWLDHVQGVENINRAQLDVGVERHRAQGARVLRAAQLRRVALLLFLVAGLAALVLLARLAATF